MTFRLGDVAGTSARHLIFPKVKRDCAKKVHHETAADALAHIAQLYGSGRAEPGSLNQYPCPHCGNGWLVGHRKVAQ